MLVLGQGKLIEYDSPAKLLRNEDGHFYSMVAEANINIPATVEALENGTYTQILEEQLAQDALRERLPA